MGHRARHVHTYTVIDFETTGLGPPCDRIIELVEVMCRKPKATVLAYLAMVAGPVVVEA
jgi:DNA polymerase III alpha subunit (gram-positive type)